jgi:DinB superfamily
MGDGILTLEEFAEVLRDLAQTPLELARLVRDASRHNVTFKLSLAEFSILENVCHLRDIETEGYSSRIHRILTETNPLLPDIDGTRLAIERDYNAQNLNEALQAFTEERRQNVEVLKQVREEQYGRCGTMEGSGAVTLAQLVLMMRDHDEGHIEDIRRNRRLDRLSDAES